MKLERNSRKLIKLLMAGGWSLLEARGSHHQFKHSRRPGRVTVPHPNRDLPKGTAHSIYRQAG
ncbi:MAG: type II toxin-antitoxin system HicA family toxin [Parvibaculaceae bacterium]